MAETINYGWLEDKDGVKFAPNTLMANVQTNDGTPLQDKIEADLTGLKVEVNTSIDNLSDTVSTNYNETIIGLSVEGQTITYIKGDGSVHTITTQDTNTEYSLGTDETTGLTKLYATIGTAEDGTMTQKAITDELTKKVGVRVDDSQGALIFT